MLLESYICRIDGNCVFLHCGDFNGHIGSNVVGYEGVHAGYGERSIDGKRLLEFAKS